MLTATSPSTCHFLCGSVSLFDVAPLFGVLRSPSPKIIVVEGNYLLLDKEPWKEVREILDGSFYLDVDLDVAMSRVARRHVDQIGEK